MTPALALIVQLAQAPAQTAAPAPPTPSPTEPAAPADPATSAVTTDTGLLLVLIKPDKTADYEAALRALQGALATQSDPVRRRAAEGWHVFKAEEPDGKGNAIYVHVLWPAVPGFDYRPSLLLDALIAGVPFELLDRYRDAFAAPPTKLSLAELARMSVAPVAPAPPSAVEPPATGVPPPKSPGVFD